MQIRLNILQKQNIPEELVSAAHGSEFAAGILYGRGFDTVEKIREFFLEDYQPVKANSIPDMDKAVSRIKAALDANERICIYGDYDVDGVTSTSILKECFHELGADCIYHVPDRFTEGYGMNIRVIEKLALQGIKLIVTCDCGISNVQEIGLANSLGMEVIVTDHHSIPEELPQAYCILNPKLWGHEHPAYPVSGAVAAFYLARALLKEYGKEDVSERFVDLLALSIVADVVPLKSENKYWLKKGLEMISEGGRLGLESLISKAAIFGRLDEDFIGFQIAPRLNAAGRLESACKGVELLTAGDSEVAAELADELNFLNISRKEIEADIYKTAEEMIAAYKGRPKNIIILYNETWHHGVIGIAAGKLCEKYNKPVILLSLKEDGKTVVGSARAPEGVPMYELLQRCSDTLLKFGGHAGAAGLGLELAQLKNFTKKAEMAAYDYDIEQSKTVNVDMQLGLDKITEELCEGILMLSPFGEGFSQPVFLTTDIEITANSPIKDIGRRLVISDGSNSMTALYWGEPDFTDIGSGFDIIYSVSESIFRGRKEIKLNILNILRREEAEKTKCREARDYIKIVDLRNAADFPSDYKAEKWDTIYFEGISNPFSVRTFNREELKKTEHLILYSAPPNLSTLKQIIKKTEPEKITFVLAGSDELAEEVVRKALGIIKYIVGNKSGETSYSELSCLLGLSYELTDSIIKYLSFSGLIEYHEVYDELIIKKGTGKKFSKADASKQSLILQMEEMNAFRRYIRTAALEDLTSALKS